MSWTNILAALLCLLIFGSRTARAQEEAAAQPNPLPADSEYLALTLTASGERLTITDPVSGKSWTMSRQDIHQANGATQVGKELSVTDSVLISGPDTLLRWSMVTKTEVSRDGREILISLFTRRVSTPAQRLRRGNLICNKEERRIDSAAFVRGSAINFGGNISIAGEINRDAIALTGDILLMPGSLVRGTVVSLFGSVRVDRDARCYGEIISGKRGRPFLRVLNASSYDVEPVLSYDRVDGLTFGLNGSFELGGAKPWKLHASAAYALESSRFRGEIGSDVLLQDKLRTTLSIEGHTLLLHDDDSVSTRLENSILDLTLKEDRWDWYEAIGVSASASIHPSPKLTAKLSYRREAVNWLPAQPRLWALSGGSGGGHLFQENFSTVRPLYDSTKGAVLSQAIESSQIGEFSFRADYQSNPILTNYDQSIWTAGVRFDYGDGSFGSSSSYRRFGATVSRDQLIDPNIISLFHLTAATANGSLPPYRIFALGGDATLPGYPIRSLVARRYLLGKFELRGSLPSKILALGLFADGVVAHNLLPYGTDTYSDAGLRFYLSGLLHVTAAVPTGPKSDGKVHFWLSLRRNF